MANIETSTDASRVIYLDSADATTNLSGVSSAGKSKKTTDVQFQLEEPIVVPPHHTILLSLHSCAIPYSFYNFQTGRNTTLTISFCDTNTLDTNETTDRQLVLTQANYNIQTLLDEIKTFVDIYAVSDAGDSVGDFIAEFNPDTLKCEWRYNGGKRLRFKFRDDQTTNFKEEIGFTENCFVQPEIAGGYNFWMETHSSVPKIGYDDGTTFTSMNAGIPTATSTPLADPQQFFSVVDVNFHVRSLYLRSNITQHSVLDSSIGSRFSNILARIPINSVSGGELVISPSDGAVHTLMLKVREITFINIRLTDKDNKLIDLNGLDFTIALQFDFIETPEVKVPVGMREKVSAKQFHNFLKRTGKKEELKAFLADENNKKFINV
tara:strand:- start:243 stop:1379 length:1137 start_codon:yes stop_codon:yes gene_type:complete